MICTTAGWQVDMTLIRREWWEHSHVPKPNAGTKPQIFLSCALGNARRGDTASKCKTIKKYGKRGEEEKERRGKKRGHSINATGRRPFKIFKIKKVLLSTSTFHFSFSSFLHDLLI